MPVINKIVLQKGWKTDFYEQDGKWKRLEHKNQATIPKDKDLIRKLGLQRGEKVLCVAAFFADWASAIKEKGLIVDYNEVSKEILEYVKNQISFNDFIENLAEI